jgi:hypothetical protein
MSIGETSTAANGFCACGLPAEVSFFIGLFATALSLLLSLQERKTIKKRNGKKDFMPKNTLFQEYWQ